MPTDEEADWNLVDFARQVAGMAASAPEISSDFVEPDRSSETFPATEGVAAADNAASTSGGLSAASVQPAPVPKPDSSGKRKARTRDEIAGMIETALRTIGNYPKRGFVITVYGSNPWNAMLTIRPEAGARIDRALWSSRVQEIGVQLRDDFEVIQETNPFTGGGRQEPAPSEGTPRKAIE